MISIIDLNNFNPDEYMKIHKKKRNRKDYRTDSQVTSHPISFVGNKYITSPIDFFKEVIINQDYLDIIPNYYIINNCGQIRTINNEMLNPKLINSGYFVYYLKSRTGETRLYIAHRLILMVFNPVPNMELLTVDHINGDKLDNRLSNLRWCTQAENNQYKQLYHQTGGIYNYNSKFNMDQLKIIVNELDKNNKYDNILNLLGLPITRNNRDYIGNIKRGITYKREVQQIRENKAQRLSKG